MWSPGPIGTPDPPIDLAAVNPWMLRVAGAHADGVHVHPLNTATYLRQTVLANLSDGAAAVGRSVSDLEVIVPAFIVAGDSEDDRARWRELARMQIAFYGSTPNYSFIFDQIDRPGTTAALRDRQRQGDLAGMAQLIDDDMLAEFVVEGPWSSIADAIADRYDGIATRVVNYFGAIAWADESSSLRPWRDITRALAT